MDGSEFSSFGNIDYYDPDRSESPSQSVRWEAFVMALAAAALILGLAGLAAVAANKIRSGTEIITVQFSRFERTVNFELRSGR